VKWSDALVEERGEGVYRALPNLSNLPAVGAGPVKILAESPSRRELQLYNKGTAAVQIFDNPQGDNAFEIPAGASQNFRQPCPSNAFWATGAAGHLLQGYEVLTNVPGGYGGLA